MPTKVQEKKNYGKWILWYRKVKCQEQYNEGKSSELEKQEKDLLEKKSEVLRRYLAENIIPVLSKGILHVCKTLPEDPVDELAYYLFDNALMISFPHINIKTKNKLNLYNYVKATKK